METAINIIGIVAGILIILVWISMWDSSDPLSDRELYGDDDPDDEPEFIHNENYYEYGKPETRERTKVRLKQIAEAGMIDLGNAQFGYPGKMSGLYIEYVWRYPDDLWDGYLNWAKEVIKL